MEPFCYNQGHHRHIFSAKMQQNIAICPWLCLKYSLSFGEYDLLAKLYGNCIIIYGYLPVFRHPCLSMHISWLLRWAHWQYIGGKGKPLNYKQYTYLFWFSIIDIKWWTSCICLAPCYPIAHAALFCYALLFVSVHMTCNHGIQPFSTGALPRVSWLNGRTKEGPGIVITFTTQRIAGTSLRRKLVPFLSVAAW